MIYQTVNESDFVEAFRAMGRGENFSVNARRELFDYYNEMSDDIGEGIELDVIAICCEWGEYTADELEAQYSHLIDADEYGEEDDRFDALLDELNGNTIIIAVGQYGEPDTHLMMEF